MTVSELRAQLANLPDDMQVIISYDSMIGSEVKKTVVENADGKKVSKKNATNKDFLTIVT